MIFYFITWFIVCVANEMFLTLRNIDNYSSSYNLTHTLIHTILNKHDYVSHDILRAKLTILFQSLFS